MGVDEKDLRYSNNTPATLGQAHGHFADTLAQRQQRYEEELATQVANDKLCQQFAAVVDPFSQWMVKQKQTVSSADGTLESQLAFVSERISKFSAESAPLKQVAALDEQIQAAGITNNIHTNLSRKDVELQWSQYQEFMKIKSKMLAEEIEKAKLRGLTPEQLKEIDDNFAQFDQDGDGTINKRELKACLYSLGEEKTNTEVEEILAKFGSGGKIPKTNFKEFMIGVLGDSETKESILTGFRLINRGSDIALHDKMSMVLPEHDVAYVEKTAPKANAGWNYQAWTDDVFSR
jgi:Ca2+-binding EF-hand superfamily protein